VAGAVSLRFLADENLDGDLLRALLRRRPGLDVVRVQDAGLASADDAAILAWAAREGRVLLTHDVNTAPGHAYARLRTGEHLSGVVAVPLSLPVSWALDDLLLLADAGDTDEVAGRVLFLPLR
jgi:hypothetical protein